MLVQLDSDNRVNGYINISNSRLEDEFLANNPNYIRTNFNFIEDIHLYEYDTVNNTFNLVADWEAIKAQREAEAEAIRLANQPTLDDLKNIKIENLHAKFDAIYQDRLKKYSQVEQSTFPAQEEEYRAYIKDNTVATPTIDTISSSRGITKEELITRIGNNINERDTNVGQLQAAETLIKTTTTEEELEVVCTQLEI